MALLTNQERLEVRKNCINAINNFPISKPDLDATIAALDAWADANQNAFNNAIPAVPRAALSLKQKLRIFEFVINKKYLVN